MEAPPPDLPPWVRLREFMEALPPAQILGATLIGVFVLAGTGLWYLNRSPPGPPVEEHLPLATPVAATSTPTPSELAVHAAGAVVHPGVHVVAPGARVADVVIAAGGVTADADLDRLNLAALVEDGQRVFVPRRGEEVPPAADQGSPAAAATAGPVPVNSADARQLETLPGVGPATAAAILEYRQEHGPFRTIEGLLNVPGIGPAKLDALRQQAQVP